MSQVEEDSKINQAEERNINEQLLSTQGNIDDTVEHGHATPQNSETLLSKLQSQEHGPGLTQEDSVQLESNYELGETSVVQENVPKIDYTSVGDGVLVHTKDDQGYDPSSIYEASTEPREIPLVQENVPKKDYTSVDDGVLVHTKDDQSYDPSSIYEVSTEPREIPLVQENVPKIDYTSVDDGDLVHTKDDQGYDPSSIYEASTEPGEIPPVQENAPKKDYTSVGDGVLVQTEDSRAYKLYEPRIEPTLVATDATDYGSERRRRSSSDRTTDNILDCLSGCGYCLVICLQIALCCSGQEP